MDNLDRENQLVMTQRKIAQKSGISYGTVAETMRALQEADFLVKINSGAYRINPDVLFKGGKNNRLNVLFQYNQVKQEAAATKTPTGGPTLEELEELGQTSLLEQQQATEEVTAASEQPVSAKEPQAPKCPSCGQGYLQVKNGKKGPFVGCTKYPNCKYTENMPRAGVGA
jgi:transcriptional regulator with XRE-family HTH domain